MSVPLKQGVLMNPATSLVGNKSLSYLPVSACHSIGVTDMHMAIFHCGYWDLNSGYQAGAASALTQPFPVPKIFFVLNYLFDY